MKKALLRRRDLKPSVRQHEEMAVPAKLCWRRLGELIVAAFRPITLSLPKSISRHKTIADHGGQMISKRLLATSEAAKACPSPAGMASPNWMLVPRYLPFLRSSETLSPPESLLLQRPPNDKREVAPWISTASAALR